MYHCAKENKGRGFEIYSEAISSKSLQMNHHRNLFTDKSELLEILSICSLRRIS